MRVGYGARAVAVPIYFNVCLRGKVRQLLGRFSKPNYASGPEMCEQECHSPYCRNIYRRDDRRTEIYKHT